MVSYFSQSKGQGLEKNICNTSSFFKGYFTTKKKDIALVGTFGLFFASYFSKIPTISLFISSSIFFTIIE
jgi:hypothetical protein